MSSFILEIMTPTYRACAEEHGVGMEKRMHDIMALKMASGSVFPSMHSRMRKVMNHCLDEMEKNFNNHIIDMCADLERHVETAGGTKAEEVSRNHARDLKAVKKALTFGRNTLPKLQRLASAGVAAARRHGYIL